MQMTQIEELIVKIIYVVLAGIVVFQSVDLNNVVSLLFYMTFILVAILWVSTLRKIKKSDVLCLVIITTAITNVLLKVLLTDLDINITFFNKLIIFTMTIIFFHTVNKTYVNLSTKQFVHKTINCLCIFLIFMYCYKNTAMHMLNEVTTKYLTFKFTNPNLTGLFVVCMAMLQIIQMIEIKKKSNQIFHFILFCVLFFFVVKTGARNCLLGLLLFFVLFLCFLVPQKEQYTIGKIEAIIVSVWPLLFSVIYLMLVNNEFVNNIFVFAATEGKALSSRVRIWTRAVEIIRENVLLGAYNSTGINSHMHNSHLDIWASYGIVTLILVCVFLMNIVFNNGKKYKKNTDIIYVYAFITTIIMGMGEAAMFSGGVGIYLLMGIFLIKNKENNCEY